MPVRIHEDASAELEAAAAWYEQRRPELGQDLLAEASRAIELIEQTPSAWPRWPDAPHRDVRQFPLARFPYRALYVILPDDVLVVAFAHTGRHPAYWRGRVR